MGHAANGQVSQGGVNVRLDIIIQRSVRDPQGGFNFYQHLAVLLSRDWAGITPPKKWIRLQPWE